MLPAGVGAKAGKSARSGKAKGAGVKRLSLVLFGALFIVLFVVFAVAQGLGQPSVPAGDVALIKGVPDGHISEAEFKRALVQQATQASLKKTPKVGSKKYEELKAATLGELVQAVWIRGEAEELGISVTDKQVETELAQIKKTNFPTEKAFKEFLEVAHLSAQDVHQKVELQLISQELEKTVKGQAPPPVPSEVTAYYQENKASQFTTKPTRDIRLIVNEDKGEVEKAKEALEKDDSAASWKVVAAKYSSDPTSKSKGGLQEGISEELLQGEVKKAIFGSSTGEIVGPVPFQKNFLLIEVEKLNPEKVKTEAEVRSQIATQLSEEAQQTHFTEFASSFESKWVARTYCASGFEVEKRCSNFKSSGHPASASPSCYEANPKTPPTECPAPVEQIKPALPGTVTLAKPTGEQFVQRPRPQASSKAKAESAAKAVEEAAGEATPETGK